MEAGHGMCVELVHHKDQFLRPPVASSDQKADELSPLQSLAMIGDPHSSPTTWWFKPHEKAGNDVACIDVVETLDSPGFHWQRFTSFATELLEGFVNGNDGVLRIVGMFVDFQDVFHVINELRRLLRRNAPQLLQMGPQFAYF